MRCLIKQTKAMNKLAITMCSIVFLGATLYAQTEPLSFYKKCLVTSVTGGPSSAIYSTRTNDNKAVHTDKLRGSIDPLIMEYGISDRLGIGFSRGGENYDVNINDFYKANAPEGHEYMWTSTKYLTLDFSYHPFVTKRIDVSLFSSIGYYTVSGNWYNNSYNTSPAYSEPFSFSYRGKGAVARAGVRTRIYLTKRFGVMGMLYAFNGYAKERQKPSTISDAPNNTGYSTMLTGAGAEFGICFRLFKQKGVTQESWKAKKIRKVKAEKEEKEEDGKVPLFRLVWD